ncbi:MAG: hypothetical protein V4660_20635 [Pseudomonadota bacterium]
MQDTHKSLRLGDLLVEKGLISAPQLRAAINLQNARYEKPNISAIDTKLEIGEIFIELGFISRHQLNVNLSWQRRLKATTTMMVFVAPLLTAACGGGSGVSSGGNANQQTQTVTSQVAADSAGQSMSSARASFAPAPSSLASARAVSSLAPSSKRSSSEPSNSQSPASSVVPSASSNYIDGAVQLLWSAPDARENGEYLDITEIGGYEVRYKLKADTNYTNIVINDGFTDAYYFNYLKGDYDFEIASFDKTGLYSEFISISPEN